MGPKLFVNTPTVIDTTTKTPEPWNVPEDGRPIMRINSNQMAEIVNWKVGEKYTIEVEMELMSLEKVPGPKGEYYTSSMRMGTYKLEKEEE